MASGKVAQMRASFWSRSLPPRPHPRPCPPLASPIPTCGGAPSSGQNTPRCQSSQEERARACERERERERERKGSRVYTRASREIANGKIAQVDVPKTTCRQRLELVVNLSLDGKIDFTVRVDAEGVVEGRVRGRRRRRRGGCGPRAASRDWDIAILCNFSGSYLVILLLRDAGMRVTLVGATVAIEYFVSWWKESSRW